MNIITTESVIVCDEKNPPRFGRENKSFINEKHRTYNAYCKSLSNV